MNNLRHQQFITLFRSILSSPFIHYRLTSSLDFQKLQRSGWGQSRKRILEFWREIVGQLCGTRPGYPPPPPYDAMKTVAAKISENPLNYLIYERAIVKRNPTPG